MPCDSFPVSLARLPGWLSACAALPSAFHERTTCYLKPAFSFVSLGPHGDESHSSKSKVGPGARARGGGGGGGGGGGVTSLAAGSAVRLPRSASNMG